MDAPEFVPNTVIDGKYTLVRQLGEGGIGTVWLGWQELVQRHVAVKFLKGEIAEEQRDRFLLEARALGRLNHPNCITIYDFGFSEEHGALYLVMEYLDGEPLSEWRGRDIGFGDIVQISKQIANALAYAHHQSVFHRDLKPENVMLVPSFTGEMLVKVLDFGLARLGIEQEDGPRLTQTGEIFGTPAYMSPEQIRGTRNAGPASDIYSLGIIMYEMIERRLPFNEATSFDLMMAHMVNPIPPIRRPAVPSELARIVMRCVEKDQERRFQSALELWESLAQLDEPLAEDSSVTFANVASPEETIDSPPPGNYSVSGFESTLENDGLKRRQQRAPRPPGALGGDDAQMATLMMTRSPGRDPTADVPKQHTDVLDLKQAALIIFTGLATLLILTLFLFFVVGADDDAPSSPTPTVAPAPQVGAPTNEPAEEQAERPAEVPSKENSPTPTVVEAPPGETHGNEEEPKQQDETETVVEHDDEKDSKKRPTGKPRKRDYRNTVGL